MSEYWRTMYSDEAADPSTPPDTIMARAPSYPAEVLTNPVLPLLALEDPGQWMLIVAIARCALAKALLVPRGDDDMSPRFRWMLARAAMKADKSGEPRESGVWALAYAAAREQQARWQVRRWRRLDDQRHAIALRHYRREALP